MEGLYALYNLLEIFRFYYYIIIMIRIHIKNILCPNKDVRYPLLTDPESFNLASPTCDIKQYQDECALPTFVINIWYNEGYCCLQIFVVSVESVYMHFCLISAK